MPTEYVRSAPHASTDPEFGPWLAQASILIVDDEPGMRNFLMRTLGPRCKHIEQAVDTEDASRKLDQHHYDVVILDNIMPKKNGVEWLAEQRAIGFFADAILMTAYASRDNVARARELGVNEVLVKPFTTDQLGTALGRILGAGAQAMGDGSVFL